MESELGVDDSRYSVRVLSGCDRSRYGCEYEIEVGLVYVGEAAENEIDEVIGVDAREDRSEDGKDEESGCAVAEEDTILESKSSPSGVRRISWTVAFQPVCRVGVAKAKVAVIYSG